VMNDSYRTRICQSNKHAAPASWPSVSRACMTREGPSVIVIRMLPQLVGLFSVERAGVKLDVFFCFDGVSDANMFVNIYFSDSYDIEASI
jgi:hypothetical protein